MVFDLRAALLRKGEVESARLDAFEFRMRARTMRLLAARIDEEPEALARSIALASDEQIVANLILRLPDRADEIARAYRESRNTARTELIEELGDPTPYRLA